MMKRLIVGPLDVNCYIIWDTFTFKAAVIDPGGDEDKIIEAIEEKELEVDYIINTHGHFDHIGANHRLRQKYSSKLAIHRGDTELLAQSAAHAQAMGINTTPSPPADLILEDGQIIDVGALKVKVIHTPGHTPGGICLYLHDQAMLFSGDTLFAGSIGRTDFPGGSHNQIIRSIKNHILTLPDETMVCPGHGPESTVEEEKSSNPYINTNTVL